MFIKREKYEDLVYKMKKQRQEIESLECEILSLKDKNKKLMEELDSELSENRIQHNKLKEITEIIARPFGTYIALSKIRTDIKKALSKT